MNELLLISLSILMICLTLIKVTDLQSLLLEVTGGGKKKSSRRHPASGDVLEDIQSTLDGLHYELGPAEKGNVFFKVKDELYNIMLKEDVMLISKKARCSLSDMNMPALLMSATRSMQAFPAVKILITPESGETAEIVFRIEHFFTPETHCEDFIETFVKIIDSAVQEHQSSYKAILEDLPEMLKVGTPRASRNNPIGYKM